MFRSFFKKGFLEAGSVAQLYSVEYLPGKCKAVSSLPSTAKEKGKKGFTCDRLWFVL
jgi:hypothetical protein